VQQVRMSLMIEVSYTHPNKEVAATVANYFAEEFINTTQRNNADAAMKLVEDLQIRAEQQHKKVEAMQAMLNDLIVQHATDFQQLDSGSLMTKLAGMHDQIAEIQQTLADEGTQLKELQDQQAADKPIWDLDFVAQDTGVRFRLSGVEQAQAALAEQENKLGPNHPDVVAAQANLERLRTQLTDYCNTVFNNLQKAIERRRAFLSQTENDQNVLRDKLAETLQLKTQRDSLQTDLESALNMYKQMLTAVEEKQAEYNASAPVFRIVDRAAVAAYPTSPNMIQLVTLGAISGLAAAVAATLLTGFALLIQWQKRKGG
jgi:uncharacterized protein involved in exopolysaccharide biosynthesis